MKIAIGWLAAGLLLFVGPGGATPGQARAQEPAGQMLHLDGEKLARGRYLARIAGCNDCHTEGYMEAAGQVAEERWLTGASLGWRGPWGTTYGTNLRLLVSTLTEDQWVRLGRTLKARPPMPWFNLNYMEVQDLQALYHFIGALGPAGRPAPAYVPPDQEPDPPYATFPAPPQ